MNTQASVTQRCTLRPHKTQGVDFGQCGGSGRRPRSGSLHPPSRQAANTSVDHHHPIGSRPTSVIAAGAWLTTGMGMGTPDHMESSLAPPALRRDLLAWIQSEPRLPRRPRSIAAARLLLQPLKARTPNVAAGPDHPQPQLRTAIAKQKGTPLVRSDRIKRSAQNDQAIPIEAQSPWHLRRLVDKVSWH